MPDLYKLMQTILEGAEYFQGGLKISEVFGQGGPNNYRVWKFSDSSLPTQEQQCNIYHQAVSSWVLAAEFLTQVGPLLIQLLCHMLLPIRTVQKRKTGSTQTLTVCDKKWQWTGNADGPSLNNALVSERVREVAGPYELYIRRHTSDNSKRLTSFASANGICLG